MEPGFVLSFRVPGESVMSMAVLKRQVLHPDGPVYGLSAQCLAGTWASQLPAGWPSLVSFFCLLFSKKVVLQHRVLPSHSQ